MLCSITLGRRRSGLRSQAEIIGNSAKAPLGRSAGRRTRRCRQHCRIDSRTYHQMPALRPHMPSSPEQRSGNRAPEATRDRQRQR